MRLPCLLGVCAGLLLLSTGAARAEIAVEDSLEWLCARADRVIVGRVKVVQAAGQGRGAEGANGASDKAGAAKAAGADGAAGAAGKAAAAGKSDGLVLFTVQATATLKGKPQPAYCVGLREQPSAPLKQAADKGAEVLLLLSETVQATSYQGLTCNLWPLRDPNYGPWMVPLDDPGRRLLGAASLQVLRDRGAILGACQQALARLPQEQRAAAAPEGERALLEAPPGTPVYQALYGGSAVYLQVPRRLFPRARATFR